MTFYFITGNKNKFEEVKLMLDNVEQLDIDLPEIQDSDAHNIIRAKLLQAFNHQAGRFIVEDTSLYLECLNGLPGPLIKWFLKTIGNDGLVNLAEKLGSNKAEAKTIIGYAKNKDNIEFLEGSIQGRIVTRAGVSGFGWDPIFQPDGWDKTFAEMTAEEKNNISMRKIALEKLKSFLLVSSSGGDPHSKSSAESAFKPKDGQVDYTNIRYAPVINCVVRHNGKILIVQRSPRVKFYPNLWHGISGFLDDRRSIEEKAQDELQEELGIEASDITAIHRGSVFDQEEEKYGKTWIVHPVLVEVKTDKVRLDWEAQNYQWIQIEDAQRFDLLPGFDRVLASLFARSDAAMSRLNEFA